MASQHLLLDFVSEHSWTVYNDRNLELMGFSDPWVDAVGIASKLSYMGSLNVGLMWCRVEHKWLTIVKADFCFRCLLLEGNTSGGDIQLNLVQVSLRTLYIIVGHCIKNMLNEDRGQSVGIFALETQMAQQKENQNLNEGEKAGGTKEHHVNAAAMPSGNPLPERSKFQLLLSKLKRRDKYRIFSEPVNPEEVEDYYNFIKEPMDFGTITTKLDGGSYKTLQEFEHDVTLVWSNAMVFNDSSTVYYKQACVIRNLAKKLFNSLKTDPENFVEMPKTGCRGGKRFKYSEAKRGSTYRPLNTSLNEKLIVSAVCLNPQEVVQSKLKKDETGESVLQFVKDQGSTVNTFAGQKLQSLGGESIKATPDRDTGNFSFMKALLGDESPPWDIYNNLEVKPGGNLYQYQRIADTGSYSSNVEEAGQDWKRFRPTEAPPQPVCSQSTSAGWSSQWLDIGASTSDVKTVKPLSLKDIDEWLRNL